MQSKLIILACLLAISQSRVLDKINIDDVLIKHRIQLGGRIIGGRDAQPGEFPHQVSLQMGVKELKARYDHFCGGSILNEKYIVTAAHCLDAVEEVAERLKPYYKLLFAIKAGKQDLSISESTEQVSEVKNWIKHEKWNPKLSVGPYDIALLKLKTPLRLNKRVVKIRLPQANSEPTGAAVLSGWGAVKYDPENPLMPKILQTLITPLITRKVCDEAIEKVIAEEGEELKNATHETNVCTGPILGGTSACGGDSGGPLILNAQDGQPELIGLVSWGIVPCGRKGAPSVYAKVSVFIDWIENAMNTI